MKRTLEAARAYFNAIKNPSEEEKRIRAMLTDDFFPITSICRDDLRAGGFDADKATDDQMEELARCMANDYCEQLFWSSMKIIAEIIGIPKKEEVCCPMCGATLTDVDVSSGLNRCANCGLVWDDAVYVLVEFPEDSAHFEEEEIGFPAFDRDDNGARFVPENEYMRYFDRTPDKNRCFRAVEWPASQEFSNNDRCILINDDEGLESFGSAAYWVPVKLLTK